MRSCILESLASQVIKYKAYPSSAEFEAVCEALVKKPPYLKEQGSVLFWLLWVENKMEI